MQIFYFIRLSFSTSQNLMKWTSRIVQKLHEKKNSSVFFSVLVTVSNNIIIRYEITKTRSTREIKKIIIMDSFEFQICMWGLYHFDVSVERFHFVSFILFYLSLKQLHEIYARAIQFRSFGCCVKAQVVFFIFI